MRINANRSHLVWTPLLGWVVLSCLTSTAFGQVPGASTGTGYPSDVTVGTPVSPGPTGTGAPSTDSSIPAGTAPVDQQGGTVQGGSAGGGRPVGTTAAPQVPTLSTLASTGQNSLIAPVGTTSSTGVLLYGAPVGTLSSGGGGGSASEELGINLGAFRLLPEIALVTGLDNNVFTQRADAGTTPSGYMTVAPSLTLRSEWLNHEVRAVLSGGFGFYSNAPTQNYQNYGIVVSGRVDIQNDFYVSPQIGYRRATEALGTPNVAFSRAPTVVDTVPIGFGIYQRFNRFFYDINGTATRYWHYDNSTISSAGLSGEQRNRWEYLERIRLGYEIHEDLSFYIQPTFSQIRYILPATSAGGERDSNSVGLSGGALVRLSPTTAFDGSVGYSSQTSSTGAGSTNATVAALSGTWNTYAPLTLRPSLTRGINETALSAYRNTTTTAMGLDFNYVIHDAWSATGGLSYTLVDYNPIDASITPTRQDKIFRGQLGLLYSLRPQVSIGPVYEYTSGSSDDLTAGPSYDKQTFSIRIIGRH